MALRVSSAFLSFDLARLAAAFVARRGWLFFGHAGPGDYCREVLDRSGRWLLDLASLGEALERLPELGPALVGEDGPPIGRVAALQVARVACRQSLSTWLTLARRMSVRNLDATIRASMEAGTNWPLPPAAGRTGEESTDSPPHLPDPTAKPDVISLRAADLLVRDEADTEVQVALPRAAAAAFEEAFELHRAVTGHSSSIASFVEALVGEAAASCLVPADQSAPAPAGISTRSLDRWTIALPEPPKEGPGRPSKAPAARAGIHSPPETEVAPDDEARQLAGASLQQVIAQIDPAALVWARELLDRVYCLARCAPASSARSLGAQLESRRALEGEFERCTARLLALYPVNGGGRGRMLSLAALGEELFGVSRRTIERRIALRRVLGWLPRVRAAYEAGDLGMQASWLVSRILGRGPAEAGLERDWVKEAREISVRRLQDEVHLIDLRRHDVLESEGEDCRRPPTDAAWRASLRCVPGATRARVEALGERARLSQNDNVFMRLRLPEELAGTFVGVIGAACGQCVETGRPAATIFTERRNRVPGWVGLLAMLEDFARTWDDPRRVSTNGHSRLHGRDRYRCMAPGCTSRSGLELHHIKFRSRGGSDDDSNLITLCRTHHRLGVHGGFMKLAGSAPLDVDCRLGHEDVGVWYRNDRRATAATGG